MRGATVFRRCGTPSQISMVTSVIRSNTGKRERAESKGSCRFPSWTLPRTVSTAGDPPILTAQSPQTANTLAEGMHTSSFNGYLYVLIIHLSGHAMSINAQNTHISL